MFLDATREATLRDCWACYLDHALPANKWLPGACTRQMKVDVGPRETAFHEMFTAAGYAAAVRVQATGC